MRNLYHKCLCCGKTFKYCNKCGKANNGFNASFDTRECAELFNAVSGYNMNTVNSNAINKVLLKHNITDFDQFVESVSSVLYALFPNMTSKKKADAPKKEVATKEKEQPANTNDSFKDRFSKKNKSQKKEVELSDETDNDKELKVDENTGISEDE